MTTSINAKCRTTVEQLYRQLAPVVASKVAYVVREREAAQDIVQSVFEKFWQEGMRFSEVKAAYAWLYVTAHHQAIDWLRKKAREQREKDRPSEVVFRDLATPEDRYFNQTQLMRVIHTLSVRESRILVYLVVDGCSQKEVADLEKLSEKTIQREVAAIREKLSRMQKETL